MSTINKNDTTTSSAIWRDAKWFISGAASGMGNTLAGHPFDTLKVRLQTEGVHGRFEGVWHCVKKTFAEEGIRGFYKGLTPPFFGMGIINMTMFGIFNKARSEVSKYFNNGDPNAYTVSQVCLAGAITGWGVTFVVVPVEQIKARLQVQYYLPKGVQPEYTGPIDCLKKLYKKNGIAGLYRGGVATLLTRTHCWAYFGGQEYTKRYFQKKKNNPNYVLNAYEQFISGGVAGTCYWLACYPLDVVKNRMMAQKDSKILKYPTVKSCFKHIYKVDGLKGFYRGFVPCALRTFPANGATFVALGWTQQLLNKLDHLF